MMINMPPDQGLLRLVPNILRARAWRLYTNKGRLIDLWQYGGKAILGHKSPGLLRAIKNNGERGLFCPLPHFAEDRFIKALCVLLPGCNFRIYNNETYLYQSLIMADIKVQLWRPYMDGNLQKFLKKNHIYIPVLPCPFPGAPAALAFTTEAGELEKKTPPSHLISPICLLAATKCIYDLIAGVKRGIPRYSRIEAAMKKCADWKRKGIYLFYKGSDYPALFKQYLEAGFLLPPSPEEPAILPGELSPGEEAKLASLMVFLS